MTLSRRSVRPPAGDAPVLRSGGNVPMTYR